MKRRALWLLVTLSVLTTVAILVPLSRAQAVRISGGALAASTEGPVAATDSALTLSESPARRPAAFPGGRRQRGSGRQWRYRRRLLQQ